MDQVNLQLKSVDESRLWKQLDSDLQARVKAVTAPAVALLKTVTAHMPLYTLHDERHILNIVGWMDWLLADAMDHITPLEAALCLLSAYTHDLGMALSSDEHTKLMQGDDPTFQRYRDRFPEQKRHIDALRAEGKIHGAQVIENHLVTSYLRETHADNKQAARMKSHLDAIVATAKNESLFTYQTISFRRELGAISISHNQPVEWLRAKLGGNVTATIGQQPVNFAFVSLVLRLADIMDFDSSRTPAILFHHLGLERHINEFDLLNKEISQREWRKHMAITGIAASKERLTYEAKDCPHPVIHHGILQFMGWINAEVKGVRGELQRIEARQGLDLLRLPDADPKITPKPGVYEYKNWSFQLDQEEIMRLLMGEALYGDPKLCIRELLQNALDALELRDLRLQLKQKQAGRQPTPGYWTDELGEKHEYAATLTWGQENGQWWIQVSDNGVGMTAESIERYFTSLGKSFYRSPAFKAEQEAMRRDGLLCTPISTFGIGVLSCFMISEKIEVKTRAADGQAADFHVTGPGSLFWAKAGSRVEQGTDVRIYLKAKLQGRETKLEHDWDRCLQALRQHFKYSTSDKPTETDTLDPGEVAARHVVWPKYPVHVDPPGKSRWTIDHLFHVRKLAPLNTQALLAKAREWEIPVAESHQPAWGIHDWTDPVTGSRVRLWFPQCGREDGAVCRPGSEASPHLPFWQLATLAEPALETDFESRQRLLVQSMFVPDGKVLQPSLGWTSAPGCHVWVDFRGVAAPRLKADRSQALSPEDRPEWPSEVEKFWERYHAGHQKAGGGDVAALLLFGMGRENRIRLGASGAVAEGFNLKRGVLFSSAGFALDLALARALARDLALARALDPARELALDHAHALALDLDRARALALDRALDLDLDLDRARALAREWHAKRPHAGELLASHFLQEGLFPNLRESWPALGMFGRDGMIGEASLTAPATCQFSPQRENQLDQMEYDFCFPLTVNPLARLRTAQPAWITDRGIRPLATLPFLFPGTELWRKHSAELRKSVGVDSLYAFIPAYDLWWKPFADWTDADLGHPQNLSLFWNVTTGKVLAYPGAMERKKMKPGTPGVQPFDEFARSTG